MRRTRSLLAVARASTLATAAACGRRRHAPARRARRQTVTLVTHDSFAVSKPVLAAFTTQTGIKVKVLKSGDAGAAS